MKTSAGSIIGGGFRLLRERPDAVLVWGVAYLAVTVGIAGGLATAIVIGVIGAGVLIGAIVWLCVRLSLAFPLTLLREEIIIGESWRLTKGRFWTLFGGFFVIWLILMLIAIVVAAITAGSYWADLMESGFTPEGMEAAAQRQIQRQFSMSATVIIGWILNALLGGLSIALFGGAVATAARDLTEDVEGIAGTFA